MTETKKYKELINELYRKRTNGIKFGLERVFSVLEKLGNPHQSFKSIHIAGTNGKGSVSKIIYTLLRTHGLNTGLFTSPHLTRFTERIIVNDREISEDEVVRLIEKIKPFAEELTFFEYVTIMAFLYFKEKNIEYAVLETGMGGRLDATNVVTPVISVITSIGLDHQDFLGADISSIAREKAGIIKKGVPVVTSKQNPYAEQEIYKKASELGCSVFTYGKEFSAELKSIDLDGISFVFQASGFKIQPLALFLPLTGLHQLENASVGLKAFMSVYPQWNENFIKEGLKNVRLQGRLEVVSKQPLIIFDIAHNPPAAEALVKSLKALTDERPVIVFGMMRDKDVSGFIDCFKTYAHKIIFTVPHYERAITYEELNQNCTSMIDFFVPNPTEAFKKGLSICKNNHKFLLCTGSTYLIGELKEYLGEKTLHRRLGELT
ncbi:MAG: bifunctional folylpolyglutamate synthase/dihydrofolate synthase [Thermodesulfovibrio aggregans]|uniref:Dihydrofolate synthase/folylpolyglutamate synthase n=1 Tax=Thermodesulfovibrio aggregans TaxID=86166 RepID=A0A2J6WPX3_9BACT|nr:MAG: bifunctional folylpolyglutamate synthase/dihydrofolate synthase [Thermodesulfovibrio aggregans]